MSIRKVVSIDQAEWDIASTPEWLHPREVDWKFEPADETPVSFLLLDEQHHVTSQASSYRSVRRVHTLDAVRALGQVEIDFDPAAYRLIIHEVAIWRVDNSGAWSKRSLAHRDAFLLRQREQAFEQQILNGHLSVVCLLEDLRVGDAIELAWTLEPRELLPGLRFTAYYAFVWTAPVARTFFTLHAYNGQGVQWRLHAPPEGPQPEVETTSEFVTWSMERPARYVPEPNVPGGHWNFPVLDVSAWGFWAEVAGFVADLWSEALIDSADAVAAQADALRVDGNLEASIRAAIRWVQEEVRYLGVDFGHGGGILPNAAGTVLRRRFGDCKDKSMLLVALLRALGVDAWPLLVATNWREAVERIQPSTAAFNHAIVTFMDGGTRRFVDPTIVGQGGDLASLAVPPYGYGLEVRKGCTELIALPEPGRAEIILTEVFDLHRKRRDGTVEQTLRASGWLADEIRAILLRSGRAAFFKARAEALQSHFPALQAQEESAQVDDEFSTNVIELRARYTLPTWGRTTEAPPPLFRYGAYGLFLVIEAIEGPEQRRQPWALRYPVHVHHRVVVKGRCVQESKPERHRLSGPGFRYKCDVNSERNQVAFDYRWETTQREIAPADWPKYCRERVRALEQAGANVLTSAPNNKAGVKWPLAWVGVALSVLVGAISRSPSSQYRAPGAPPRSVEWSPPRPSHPTNQPVSLLGQQPDTNISTPLQTIDITPAVQLSKAKPASTADRQQAARDIQNASIAIKKGDYRAAMPLLQKVYPYYAGDFQYHALRAEAAIHLKDWKEADAALMAAQSIQPKHPSLSWLKFLREQMGQ